MKKSTKEMRKILETIVSGLADFEYEISRCQSLAAKEVLRECACTFAAEGFHHACSYKSSMTVKEFKKTRAGFLKYLAIADHRYPRLYEYFLEGLGYETTEEKKEGMKWILEECFKYPKYF